ncbi:TonB-dependent receptor [Brumimicrobium mesophilum]|uniref:TonB-dependent receptor n=1 Tax=Brumimicrobium mesophilum TaxID=392717 RepID=UPI000D1448FF|nr:TonB-dependent receptor [Brumimicrobium mesophilum]
MKGLLLLSILFSTFFAFTQENATFSGSISDFSSGEEIIGVQIYTSDHKFGALTNEYGFFSLTLPKGEYSIIVSYFGYEKLLLTLDLSSSIQKNIQLKSKLQEFEEVTVSGTKENDNITNTEIGVDRLRIEDIDKLPMIFGEKDILKAIQLLPGVKDEGEGSAGFTVRGGAADQNLILLDEATVYSASHLLGFFSTFNSDAIKDVTLYKGNQPANYGGRLSSVVDIKMKEGNNKKFQVDGGIGLIASRLTVQGPIVKNKGSFMISGRRTYADFIAKGFSKDLRKSGSQLYFYDLNAKANYKLGEKDRIFISGYFGRDNFIIKDKSYSSNEFGEIYESESQFGLQWGNKTGTIRWNHIINNKLFSNTSLIYSNFDFRIISENNYGDDYDMYRISSIINDIHLKQDFQWFANSKHKLKFGLDAILHQSIPGMVESEQDNQFGQSKFKRSTTLPSLEMAAYVSDDFQITNKLTATYGLRFSTFSVLGNGESTFTFDKDGSINDSLFFRKGEFAKTYYNIEPRLALSYAFSSVTSIKAAYARNTQNIHTLSPSISSNPMDIILFTSYHTKPSIADQIAVGWFRNFYDNKLGLKIESYFKKTQNEVDYRNSADFLYTKAIEGELLYGKGRAYGLELQLKKNKGDFTGWVSYSLSRTERKMEGINYGEWYNARQDRTHDLSVVGMYDINSKLTLSATFVLHTGNAVTFPTGFYYLGENYYPSTSFSGRNQERMPLYHRLDLGLTWKKKSTEKYESSFNFSLYNAYGQANAYMFQFEQDYTENGPGPMQARKISLFRFVPSITWNFKIK